MAEYAWWTLDVMGDIVFVDKIYPQRNKFVMGINWKLNDSPDHAAIETYLWVFLT